MLPPVRPTTCVLNQCCLSAACDTVHTSFYFVWWEFNLWKIRFSCQCCHLCGRQRVCVWSNLWKRRLSRENPTLLAPPPVRPTMCFCVISVSEMSPTGDLWIYFICSVSEMSPTGDLWIYFICSWVNSWCRLMATTGSSIIKVHFGGGPLPYGAAAETSFLFFNHEMFDVAC